jgi:hypothetical protein
MRKHGAKNKLKDTEREDSNYMGLAVPMLLAAVISIAIPLQQANAQLTFGNPPINLSNNPTNSFRPGVAVSGNNVYVVWHDGISGNYEVFFKKSTDGGATFSSPINLSNNRTESTSGQISVSGNNVYVIWQEGHLENIEILFKRMGT